MSTKKDNKPFAIAKMFLGSRAFSGGKPNKNFFAVVAFFKQRDISELCLIEQYLTESHERPETMKELYYKAKKWSADKCVTKITSTKVVNYLELILEKNK